MIGTRLGSYEITAKLGEGGMGEVYPARGTKLDRDVAIKVLPQHLAADAEVLARPEREAKAAALASDGADPVEWRPMRVRGVSRPRLAPVQSPAA